MYTRVEVFSLERRIIFVILAASLFLPLVFGTTTASDDYPKTIIDSAGREVTIQMPIERIIVMHTDAAEAVRLLGAEDKIVGMTDTVQKKSDYFPELQDGEIIGTWREFDFEKIAQIAQDGKDTIVPDIIVIGYPSGSYKGSSYAVDSIDSGLADFVDSGSISVVGVNLNNPETMEQELSTLAEMLEKENEAQDFLDWYYEKVGDVKNAMEGLPLQKVYVERPPSKGLGELKTVGAGSEIHNLLEIAGGYNICKETISNPIVTWEWVMTENPDVILMLPATLDPSIKGLGWDPEAHGSLIEEMRDGLTDRDGAEFVSAVNNDRVYVVYRDIFFGADQAVGLTYLAKIMHPDVELDPDEVYREYLDHVGLEYPEGNVFAYPIV